jgi:hypothetical protein
MTDAELHVRARRLFVLVPGADVRRLLDDHTQLVRAAEYAEREAARLRVELQFAEATIARLRPNLMGTA